MAKTIYGIAVTLNDGDFFIDYQMFSTLKDAQKYVKSAKNAWLDGTENPNNPVEVRDYGASWFEVFINGNFHSEYKITTFSLN